MTWPTERDIERGTECPKCKKLSPLWDCTEIDIGVGIQEFNHEYACPEHGRFAFCLVENEKLAVPVFADDQPEAEYRIDP